jgi:hypothetical protein
MTTNLPTANSTVPAVANDIRDLKPPLEITNGWTWLWPVVALVVVALVAFLIWRWWRKKQDNRPAPAPIPAHVRARHRLAEALALLAQPKPFCILVSDTVRLYLEERFNFHAPERTTEEFLREIGGSNLLLSGQKDSVGKFLESCDLVKFAKYEPGENELRELHSAALQLVEETQPVMASAAGSPAIESVP